jgi:NADP-dependent aldehyde dehydrogenase
MPPNLTIAEACQNAQTAFPALTRLPAQARASILDAIAAALEARRPDILTTCAAETALTPDELTPEFTRMTGTLRMFAALIREGSWVRASIDTPYHGHPARGPLDAPVAPEETTGRVPVPQPIGPNHDLRSLLLPLGPVAIFGSSNFPLAYGVCGGDTASALAAGCPVIVKEHPAHPRTGRLLASIAQESIQDPRGHAGATGAAPPHPVPAIPNLLQYLYNDDPQDLSIAQQLIQHPNITAVGFTGSIPGGLAIERLGRERPIPIPVFAEMGSNNIVLISNPAASARAEHIADELAASILQRFGQQCTRPGTIIIEPGEPGDRLATLLGDRIAAAAGRDMLAPWIKTAYERRLARLEGSPIVRLIARGRANPGERASFACLLRADIASPANLHTFGKDTLRDEVFGPAAIIIRLPLDKVPDLNLRASLTYSIYAEPSEITPNSILDAAITAATRHSGRIIFNGIPTGVRVATSMIHGGPYPATNRPDTTAVGPLAIQRWCRPICFQNHPDALLPPEIQNANPRGIWRTINGEMTQASVLS